MKIANSRVALIISIVISIGIFVLACIYDPHATSLSENDGILIFALIPAAVVIVLRRASSQVALQEGVAKQAAQSLGYAYQQSISIDNLPGKLFTLGKDRTAVQVCTGTHESFPIEVFIYSYATTVNWIYQFPSQMVWHISLDKSLPHIIFNWWPLGQPPDVESAILEGDFSKKFNVYITKGAQTEAQQVFQANIVATIETMYDDFGFEIIDRNLYLMHDLVPLSRSNTVETWLKLHNRAIAFSDLLIPELLRLTQVS